MGAAQFEYWRHTQLIIVVVPGRGGGFSLEAPEGVRFLTGSRDAEAAELNAAGGPPQAACFGASSCVNTKAGRNLAVFSH